MHQASCRTLVQALIASLLIHALILLRVAGLSPVQIDAPAATIKVLVRQEARNLPTKPVSAPVAKPLAEPVKPAAPKPRTVATPQLAVPEPSSITAAAAVPAQPELRESNQPAPSALPASSAGGSAPKVVTAPAPVREGVSADELRQYRLSLATAAKRFKRYPALARERGWEGSVDIALNGSSLLPEPEIVLLRSSGRTLLDEQALAMMAQAARATTLPEGMRGRNFRIQLTMEFNLENDQ
jgi:protein TonB